MAAVSKESRVRTEHPNPEHESPMVEFYLERQQFMDPSKEYVITSNVNSYEFKATFGKMNRLPKNVVAVLKNAKSAIHPMKNASKVDVARGGEGRSQSEFMQSQSEVKYINDYNIVQEKEL